MEHWRMTEPPGGPFQAETREVKTGIPYSVSLTSLFNPGADRPFFPRRPRSLEALAAEISRLAYCRFDGGGREIETALTSVRFALEARPYDDGNTQAFIASSRHLRVLTFRGSDDLRAWQTNLKARPVGWAGPGLVHEGFAEAFEKCWTELRPALHSREDRRPVVVTGHSLGGALATLAASRLDGCLLYSFGAPRVGDRSFARALDRCNSHLHRYVNYRDPVPLLPPALFGYSHCGKAYYINKDGRVVATPPPRRSDQERNMRGLLDRLMATLREPNGHVRNDLTDHAPVNYSSALS